MKPYYDISQIIREGIAVWPGDTQFSLQRTCSIEPGCPTNVSSITLSTHTGSHADMPLHFVDGAEDAAHIPLDAYLGPALLIDLSAEVAPGSLIDPHHLEHHLPQRVERVLFKLFKTFPHHQWQADFPAISVATVQLLAQRGCRLIGLDVPSLDPQNSDTLDTHWAVYQARMAILEGLVLDDVPPGYYELIALPLKIEGADGSPVRAILRSLPFKS